MIFVSVTLNFFVFVSPVSAFDPFYYTNFIINNRFTDPFDDYNPYFYGNNFAYQFSDMGRFAAEDMVSFDGVNILSAFPTDQTLYTTSNLFFTPALDTQYLSY